jgi:hypothetical protein
MTHCEFGMVWYGAPSTPRQCVPVTEGGGFIQHLLDARIKQVGQSAPVRGWVCLCGRWRLYELLRAHIAKVIGLEMHCEFITTTFIHLTMSICQWQLTCHLIDARGRSGRRRRPKSGEEWVNLPRRGRENTTTSAKMIDRTLQGWT